VNIEAFCASRHLERAIEHLARGRLTAALHAVRKAKTAVDKLLDEPLDEQSDGPHSESCICRPCHEAMLEKL
jgi:plasmid stabilization system protein ParE